MSICIVERRALGNFIGCGYSSTVDGRQSTAAAIGIQSLNLDSGKMALIQKNKGLVAPYVLSKFESYRKSHPNPYRATSLLARRPFWSSCDNS